MLKFQIILIVVLIACVPLVSCDRARQTIAPVLPDEDTMEPRLCLHFVNGYKYSCEIDESEIPNT